MTKDEIRNLGRLSRIALTEYEVETFNQEIDSILSYVSTIKDIAKDVEGVKTAGARFNVFRLDEVTNTPGQYTEAMLKAMPKTNGQYLSVKKILKQTD
jgi:aspartyl/glutamyl-tRNA(Asn/Gln) amidotransferase C subunit